MHGPVDLAEARVGAAQEDRSRHPRSFSQCTRGIAHHTIGSRIPASAWRVQERSSSGTSLAEYSTMTVLRLIRTFSCIALLLVPSIVSGQTTPQPASGQTPAAAGVSGRHGIGFSAGLLSGLGFAYRRHFANDFGLHIGGVAWGNKTDSFTSLGVEVLRTFSRSDKVRFYGLAGAALFRNDEEFDDFSGCYPVPPPTSGGVSCPVTRRQVSGSLSFGAGIGMEFTPGRHIGVSLEVPVSVLLDLEESERFSRKGIYPIPSIAIIYYF